MIAWLRATARKAAADPAVQQSINLADSPIMHLDTPDFQTCWDANAAATTEAVRKIGKVECRYARLANLIARHSATRKDQGPVLVLDAGDYSMGTARSAPPPRRPAVSCT